MPTFSAEESAIYAGKAKYDGTKGFLYVTNRRLFFEYIKGFPVSRTYTSLDIPLDNITNVIAEKPIISFASVGEKIVITTRRGTVGFGLNRIEFSTEAEPDLWVVKINEAISKSKSKEEPSVVVEKEMVRIPCKHCGELVDIAKESSCPRCGAKLL
jgi:hypothetical protein